MGRKGSNIVAIGFHHLPPPEVAQLSKDDKYCTFMGLARTKGPFCVAAENITCPLARFHLGIDKPDLNALARTLVDWSDAADQATGLKFLRSAPRMEGSFRHVVYCGGPTDGLKADIVVRICSPAEAQAIVRRYSAKTGDRVNSPLSGIGAACGECTAYVLTAGAPVVSVGCAGSRRGIGLQEDELLIAAPSGSKMCDLLLRGV